MTSLWRGGRTFRHPADRTEARARGRFERLAEYTSFLASSPLFFTLCAAVVLVWAAGLIVGASNRFETGTAGAMTAVTLILVALLKNAELRSERAIQQKLDAIASALLEDKQGRGGDAEQRLEGAIGVHDEI
jgi:low affinity Fe/Cu permease